MTSFFSSEKLDWSWRILLVQSLILVLFLLGFLNIPISFVEFKILFFFMALFYWSVYRPSLFSGIFLFFLGFLQDIIIGYPIGLHAVFYITFYFILKAQRTFIMAQTYFVQWLIFSLSVIFLLACEWIFFSLISLQFFGFEPLLWSFVFTICIYPFMVLLFIPIHKLLPTN
ncbi:MAG: rod shape-determining protein MreD [Pseudomonadota bacterium]